MGSRDSRSATSGRGRGVLACMDSVRIADTTQGAPFSDLLTDAVGQVSRLEEQAQQAAVTD